MNQIQCGECTAPQGHSCVFKPTAIGKRRTSTEGTSRKQIPHLGPQQGKDEDQGTLKTRPKRKSNIHTKDT